ncbi:unnamed protein product [Agarophyton chilense]|eukprot:gb/GEZJ01006123.1/.p1 GENE.gb/GEZJ01006123.1/~~gb/GEZJ01006123.1/.p1  ORF type:complete len:467 (-),score=45.80 gb/GEZJ01006123.1/:307-1707(-)
MSCYDSIPLAPKKQDEENQGLVSQNSKLSPSPLRVYRPVFLLIASLFCFGGLLLSWNTHRFDQSQIPALYSPKSISPTRITFVDEDGESGETMTSSSDPKSWLTSAVVDWMLELSDSQSIAHVSIPGTHDSGARYGGAACETQSWTIAKQLEAGIRFFDIRCRPAGTVFAIHHGVCFQEMFFGEVLLAVDNFLRAHPSEFVLMNVQEEHKPMDGSSSFDSIWRTYMSKWGYLFLDRRSTLPTVGQSRGKILALLPSSLTDKGIQWGGSLTDMQNIYKVYALLNNYPFGSDTASIGQKKGLVREYIDKAPTSNKLIINFLSGAVGMIPKDVARSTNQNAYEHIGPYKATKRVGVITMDFPGDKLVYRVIKTNFATNEYCSAKTFRTQSDKTWAEFRLPRATVGTIISFKGGAYYRYSFPKCHRATWTDLRFTCGSTHVWEKVQGSWNADAWCSSSNTNQDYLATGNR